MDGKQLCQHAYDGDIDGVKHILQNDNTFIDEPFKVRGWGPYCALYHACMRNHPNIATLLIEYGCNVNVKTAANHGNWTPLMVAAYRGNEECVRIVLQAGADWTLVSTRGETARDIAQRNNKQGVVQILDNWTNEANRREREERQRAEAEAERERIRAAEEAERERIRAAEEAERERIRAAEEAENRRIRMIEENAQLRTQVQQLGVDNQRLRDTIAQERQARARLEATHVQKCARLEAENQGLLGDVAELRGQVQRHVADEEYRKANELCPESVNATFGLLATSRSSNGDNGQVSSTNGQELLNQVLPPSYSSILMATKSMLADLNGSLPSTDVVGDIELRFKRLDELRIQVVNCKDQRTLNELLHERHLRECEMLALIDRMCIAFGCNDRMPLDQWVVRTSAVIQRSRRVHELTLQSNDVATGSSLVGESSSVPSKSVMELLDELRGIASNWCNEYTKIRSQCERESMLTTSALAGILEVLGAFARGDNGTELSTNQCGEDLSYSLIRTRRLLNNHRSQLAKFGQSFPFSEFKEVYAEFTNVMNHRLSILNRCRKILTSSHMDVYNMLKHSSREQFVKVLHDDFDSMKVEEITTKHAVHDAERAVERGKYIKKVSAEKLKELQAELKRAEKAQREAGRQYHKDMVDRVIKVERLAAEVFSSAQYDDDECVQLLRKYRDSECLTRIDIKWHSFDSPPIPLVGTASRHTVFKGVLNGETFALKRYDMHNVNDLLKEVRTMRHLEHPYVAEVCFVMVDSNQSMLHVVMPYYEGGSLQHMIDDMSNEEQQSQVDPLLVKHIARQLIIALDHVHRRSIVHCDVKPDNIFITYSTDTNHPWIKLGDFDMSKDDEARTSTTSTLLTTVHSGYTPDYAAPELFPPRSAKSTTKADIFSAALCIMDFVIGGRANRPQAPFTKDKLRSCIKFEGGDGLVDVLYRMLSDDPAKRANASELITMAYFSSSEVQLRDTLVAAEEQRLGSRMVCVVCMSEVYEVDGVPCPNHDVHHFLCLDCFKNKVEYDSKLYENNDLEARNGHVFCAGFSMNNCACHKTQDPVPYDDRTLAQHLPADVFRVYLDARGHLLEARAQHASEAKARAEFEEWLRMDKRERAVSEARRHIVENILTLKCTNPSGCGQAFVDFEGCFALECSRCRTEFCGWCLLWCNDTNTCHRHVAHCEKSLSDNLYGTDELFQQSNHARRVSNLRVYLPSLSNQVACEVLRSLSTELRALGLDDILRHYTTTTTNNNNNN